MACTLNEGRHETISTTVYSAFLTLSGTQLPPQRRITPEEASTSMLPANANAAAAPPAMQAQSSRPTSGAPSFPSAFGAGTNTGTAYAPGAYGSVNMSRLPVGVTAQGAGNDTVSGNTRKKARLA